MTWLRESINVGHRKFFSRTNVNPKPYRSSLSASSGLPFFNPYAPVPSQFFGGGYARSQSNGELRSKSDPGCMHFCTFRRNGRRSRTRSITASEQTEVHASRI